MLVRGEVDSRRMGRAERRERNEKGVETVKLPGNFGKTEKLISSC